MQSGCQTTCIYRIAREWYCIALHQAHRPTSVEYIPLLFLLATYPDIISLSLSSRPLSRQLGIHLSINLISASSKPRPDRRTQTPTPDPSESKQAKKNTTKNRQNSSLIKRPPPLPPSHPHLKRTASSSPDASHPPSSPRRPHPTDSTPQSWSARAPAAPCGG